MRPPISVLRFRDTVTVCECHADSEHKQGHWLYDAQMGMNIAVATPTVTDALVSALVYYQKKYAELTKEHRALEAKVQAFFHALEEAGDNPEEVDDD